MKPYDLQCCQPDAAEMVALLKETYETNFQFSQELTKINEYTPMQYISRMCFFPKVQM